MLVKTKKKRINQKSILIFGITGQDGSLLAKHYINKNFKVYGVVTSKKFSSRNLDKLNIIRKVKLFHNIDVNEKNIKDVITKSKCSVIYLLSGVSSVKKSEKLKYETITSNNLILIEILQILTFNKLKKIKVFNASSGEIFGDNKGSNNENSKINPLSYYALAKSISLEIGRAYREQFKLKIYNGILFNHESILRPKTYVIKKIISGVNDISNKKINKLKMGNTEVYRDWGWAPEYVKIIYKIMNSTEPSDYIIATGKITKLDHIISKVFNNYKIKKKNFLIKSKNLNRKIEPIQIKADITKLKNKIKYVPKILIDSIISSMIMDEKR
jgi:GDPmannose 4,6-dehydratase